MQDLTVKTLNKLCINNGINFEILRQTNDWHSIKELFAFFDIFLDCQCLSPLISLTKLKIVACQIENTLYLDKLSQLEELWICESGLKDIPLLDGCSKLKCLYLFDNQITEISNIQNMRSLKTLWLNKNKITVIEGLDECKNLKDLNLAANKITKIGDSMKKLTNLEKLNLSGNKIELINEISNLQYHKYMISLNFISDMYMDNGLTENKNYLNIIIYFLPNLWYLDDILITKDMFDNSMNYFEDKHMFYRLDIFTRKCILLEQRDQFDHQFNLAIESIDNSRKLLLRAIKTVERHSTTLFGCFAALGIPPLTDEDMDEVFKLKGKLLHVEKEYSEIGQLYENTLLRINNNLQFDKEVKDVEFSMCGDLVVSELEPTDHMFLNCTQVLKSFICERQLRDMGVSRTRIHRIRQIQNHSIDRGFKEAVRSHGGREKTMLLYCGENLIEIMRDGISEESCEFTNSLHYLLHKRKSTLPISPNNAYWTLLLVNCCSDHSSISSRGDIKLFVSKSEECDECRGHFFRYKFKSPALIVPKYIIEVEFLLINSTKWNISCWDYTVNLLLSPTTMSLKILSDTIGKILSTKIDKKCLEYVATSLTNVTVHGIENIKLGDLANFELLVKLDISHTKLRSLRDIDKLPNLKYLDASDNLLEGMDMGIKKKHITLDSLILHTNLITNYHSTISALSIYFVNLTNLDIRFNKFGKFINKQFVLYKLPNLSILNDEPIKQQIISHTNLSDYYQNTNMVKGLLTSSVHSTLFPDISSILTPICLDNNIHMITALYGDNTNICGIVDISSLKNLKWLSLNENSIEHILGIEDCKLLMQVSLAHNLLEHVDWISELINLRYVDISYNRISDLPENPSNDKIYYFNGSNNKITKFHSLSRLENISELFLKSNQIINIKEIYYFKKSLRLRVIELRNNPCCLNYEDALQFMVYNIPTLVHVNGLQITSSIVQQAKNAYEGLLDDQMLVRIMKKPDGPEISGNSFVLCNNHIKRIHVEFTRTLSNLKRYFMGYSSVDLSHNEIRNFDILVFLPNLRALNLNNNKIDGFKSQSHPFEIEDTFQNLEILTLKNNSIRELSRLELDRMSNLVVLNISNNLLGSVHFKSHFPRLGILDLSNNKIVDFTSQTHFSALFHLNMSNNKLKSTQILNSMIKLEYLLLEWNRIQSFDEIKRITSLIMLKELTISSNPITRKLNCSFHMISALPQLDRLNGISVGEEVSQVQRIFQDAEPEEAQPDTVVEQPKPPKVTKIIQKYEDELSIVGTQIGTHFKKW